MRTVHRVLSLIACLFLLYIGVTGTLIQTLDLTALLTGKPESDPTMQSINEGRFGNGFYSAVTRADWSSASLPANVDVARGFSLALTHFHEVRPDMTPAFVELRMVDGRVVGQVAYADPGAPPDPRRMGTPVSALAFDIATGRQVAPIDVRGAYPAPSLRQTLKQWHRFWGPNFFGLRDVPGVYIELLCGLAMSALIVTGLVMYFRLLKQRRKIKRPGMFWMTSDRWRSLHRGVSVAASVLLILVAFSGTWIGFESAYATFNRHRPRPKHWRSAMRRPPPSHEAQCVRSERKSPTHRSAPSAPASGTARPKARSSPQPIPRANSSTTPPMASDKGSVHRFIPGRPSPSEPMCMSG